MKSAMTTPLTRSLCLAAFCLGATALLRLSAADDFDPYAFDDAPSPSGNAAASAETNAPGGAASPAAETPTASEIKRENLITNSPFRRIRPRETLTTQVLEIRGFTGRGADLEISITNPATRECHWVKVRDPDAKWFVESADPIARTAVVRMNGIPINIEIVKASENPIPIVASGAPPRRPATAMPGRPAVPGAVGGGAPGVRNNSFTAPRAAPIGNDAAPAATWRGGQRRAEAADSEDRRASRSGSSGSGGGRFRESTGGSATSSRSAGSRRNRN
ncbi:MAG: hypothetical protein LBS59_07275 [Puniceicoccales bacterium]|jgi:hypothetical protein|nr:hypothetical protein [Puniceicoccales bacterium]